MYNNRREEILYDFLSCTDICSTTFTVDGNTDI
nr:MAG TPA: hypothetical protein [Caudoviricetes sp.]